MERVGSARLAILLGFLLIGLPGVSTAQPSVLVGSASVEPGEPAAITLDFVTGEGIVAFDVTIAVEDLFLRAELDGCGGLLDGKRVTCTHEVVAFGPDVVRLEVVGNEALDVLPSGPLGHLILTADPATRPQTFDLPVQSERYLLCSSEGYGSCDWVPGSGSVDGALEVYESPPPPSGPCRLQDLVISAGAVEGEFSLCRSIASSGAVTVVGPTTFRAGKVMLADGFSVTAGASLAVETGLFATGGTIPAGDPGGLELLFEASGLSQVVSRVSVRLEMTHERAGDLTAVLTSPGGVARLVLFGRPGHRPLFAGGDDGASATFDGVYVFDDFARGDLWSTLRGLNADDVIPPGAYRTSTAAPFGPGGNLLSNAGGCVTYLSGAFSGLTADQANGTWSLKLVDATYSGISGAVTAASLFLEESPAVAPIPIEGSSVRGSCTPAKYDFTGTGRTSFAVTRPVGDAGEEVIRWFIVGNDGTPAGQAEQIFDFGLAASDFLVADDYDGDGIWDAAVWSNGTPGVFMVRRSSRPTDAPIVIELGQAGDDPVVTGDYDGDGAADPAVHRLPAVSGPGSFLVLKSSLGGLEVDGFSTVMGTNQNVFADGGLDHTGDGVADLLLQQVEAYPLTSLWALFDGATGAVRDELLFGVPGGFLVPGNRVGDARADVYQSQVVAEDIMWTGQHYTELPTAQDVLQGLADPCLSFMQYNLEPCSSYIAAFFGLLGDLPLTGDFDGDGFDDFAVWRPVTAEPGGCGDSDPVSTDCQGFVAGKPLSLPSDVDVVLEFRYGVNGDYPVANARVR